MRYYFRSIDSLRAKVPRLKRLTSLICLVYSSSAFCIYKSRVYVDVRGRMQMIANYRVRKMRAHIAHLTCTNRRMELRRYVLVIRPGRAVKCPSSHGTRNSPTPSSSCVHHVWVYPWYRSRHGTYAKRRKFFVAAQRADRDQERRASESATRECASGQARGTESHRHERRNLRSHHPCMQMRWPWGMPPVSPFFL